MRVHSSNARERGGLTWTGGRPLGVAREQVMAPQLATTLRLPSPATRETLPSPQCLPWLAACYLRGCHGHAEQLVSRTLLQPLQVQCQHVAAWSFVAAGVRCLLALWQRVPLHPQLCRPLAPHQTRVDERGLPESLPAPRPAGTLEPHWTGSAPPAVGAAAAA
jgi:hypothetical protein